MSVEAVLGCCCGGGGGTQPCCPCLPTMPTSYIVQWTGSATLGPMSCEDAFRCQDPGTFQTFFYWKTLLDQVPMTMQPSVVTLNLTSCDYSMPTIPIVTDVVEYLTPIDVNAIEPRCNYTNFVEIVNREIGSRPRVEYLRAPDPCVNRPYWECMIQTLGLIVVFRSPPDFRCTPTEMQVYSFQDCMDLPSPFGLGCQCSPLSDIRAVLINYSLGAISIS